MILMCIILPIILFIVSVYGLINPLKAYVTINFIREKYLKTEESTIFVNRMYACLLITFSIGYTIFVFLSYSQIIIYNKYIFILAFIGTILIPLIITIIIYLFFFDKNGNRKK